MPPHKLYKKEVAFILSKAILSIDGGGMKGIISAVVIRQLEWYIQEFTKNPDARIGEYFDLIAGTSTGAILAALYLCPDENNHPKYSAEEILNFYLTMGDDVFEKQRLFPLFGSKYTVSGFQKILKEYFGNIKISQLVKPCLLTSYDTTRRSARFFNSVSALHDQTRDFPIRELVLASCSAPTYFPPACLDSPDCPGCYVDGGVVANNPALCAMIETLKMEDCSNIRDIHILSIGNIENYTSYKYKDVKKWGLLEWAIPIFCIFKDSNEQTVHYQLQTLYDSIQMPGNYLRIAGSSNGKIPAMDDISTNAAQYFLLTGRKLIQAYQQRMIEFAKWLISRKD